MAGAESGGLGGMTAGQSDEQRCKDGGWAAGDHGGGRPPWDVSSGKTVLLWAVNNEGWSVWGGNTGEQSSWGVLGASKDTILSSFGPDRAAVYRRRARAAIRRHGNSHLNRVTDDCSEFEESKN